MAGPVLKGTPINLKTTGNSTFWIYGTGLGTGAAFEVLVERLDGGAGHWEGTLKTQHPNNPRGFKAQVSFNPAFAPLTKKKKKSKKKLLTGELIEVDITVTNTGTGNSGVIGDQAIIN
jgi:hypothetical protein